MQSEALRQARRRSGRTRGTCVPALSALALGALLMLAGCRSSEVPAYTTQFNAFDATIDLSIVGVQRERATTAAAALERDFRFFDRILFQNGSTRLQRLNERLVSGDPVATPPALIPLIARTQVLSEKSGGLFNPALGRLADLWELSQIAPPAHPPPDEAAIKELLDSRPRMSDLHLDGISLQSDNPAVQLDFDAVASAYAMDLAVEALRAQGIRSAMINAGGDVRLIGNRSGRPWRVPVPRASATGVVGILDISGDASLATASRQRRNFIYQGQLYHAVLDPRTGYPASTAASATVLHEGDALTAAAAAHALMIAGTERWPQIAAAMGIRYALVIANDGSLHLSPAMARILDLLDANLQRIVHTIAEEPSRPQE